MYAKQHDRILNAIMDLVTSPTNVAWPAEPEDIIVGPGGGGAQVGPRQGINPDAARRLADALCMREQRLEHSGTISVTGSLPRQERDYSPHTGSSNLEPVPPVNPPAVVRGLIETSNQPDGDSDKRGENGYSYYNKQGVIRNDGETWVLRAGKVLTVGSVMDARTDDLGVNTRKLHDFVDCRECSDGKGRDRTDVRVRVFNNYPGALRNTETIHYIRDLNGLAYQVTPNPDARYGIVQSGYDNKAVYDGAANPAAVSIRACDHQGLNTTGVAFTSKVLKRANKDPALFTDYVVAYIGDDDAGRVVISDCYDKPIKKSVEVWNGTSSTIKDGWTLCTGGTIDGVTTLDLSDLFIVGTTSDAAIGTTGGSHPIRPRQHDDGESFSTTDTWSGTWKDTAWRLTTVPSFQTDTKVTKLVVDSFSGSSGTQALSIVGGIATTALALTGTLTSTNLSIASHPDHFHEGNYIDVLTSASCSVSDLGTTTCNCTCALVTATTSVWLAGPSFGAIDGDDAAITLAHAVSPDPHGHTLGTLAVDPDPHGHGLGTLAVSPDPHDHTINHTHTTTDPGHFHTSPAINIVGSLWHREEDYRPPFMKLAYIQRTH